MLANDPNIEQSYRDIMNTIANFLDRHLNPPDHPQKVCFTLLVTEFGDHGRCNYISNGRKSDIMGMMKELVAKYEHDTGQTLPVPK